MTKDKFFEKHQSEGSQAILCLDAADDQSKFCYEALLFYREYPLDECIALFSEEKMSEREFVEWMLDELNWVIRNAQIAKQFIKKRQKALKEDAM